MARPRSASRGPLEPDSWPDWVLAFGGGCFPDDKVKQSAQMLEFRQWQQDRSAWFLERGIEHAGRLANVEHRRRAAVWQEDHPEDAGR